LSFDAAIFDLDGTLVDSLEDLADSVNQVLEESGYPPHPLHAYRRFVGDGIVALVRRALPPSARDQQSLARCTDEMRDVYAERWNRKTRPYRGIPELLTELERRGIVTGVLSNKPHAMTQKVVGELLPTSRFDAVLGAEAGFPRKPDPAGALEAARMMNVSPEKTVYFGDSDTDMHTANAAGMYAVGVLWGFRDGDELRAAGARTLVSSPDEIALLFAGDRSGN
jgi:phosphoglycolate phosphatase